MREHIAAMIKDVAPLLSQTLLGNYAGLAMSLINLAIGNKGDEQNALAMVQNDPRALENIKAAEEANASMLNGLLSDLQNARQMQNVGNVRKWLMVILVIGLIFDVVLMYIVQDSQTDHVLLVIFGLILGEIKQIYKLYFGYGELPNGKETY